MTSLRRYLDIVTEQAVLDSHDPILSYIGAAVMRFGQKSLYGGNCGQFALALANHLETLGVRVEIAIICEDARFEEFGDDLHPMDIMSSDVPVYHVALSHNGFFYDADGKVTGDHIADWVESEYQDSEPALIQFPVSAPQIDTLIRSETAWSIPAETFGAFFQTIPGGK